MKVPRSISILLLLLGSTTACQTWHSCDDEVVCETYIHRYGVPLEPQDWLDRGQDGQVVSMRKDGVIVTHSYDGGILHGECTYSFPYREAIQKKDVYDQGRLVRKWIIILVVFPANKSLMNLQLSILSRLGMKAELLKVVKGMKMNV